MTRKEIHKLDKLWSAKIRSRGKCEYCGATAGLHGAHIIGRRYRGTRWDLENGLALCYTCHNGYDEHGPIEDIITNFIIGKERKQRLIEKAKHAVTKNQDFETIKESLGDKP